MQLRRLVVKGLCAAAMVLIGAAGEREARAAKTHPLKMNGGVLTVDGLTVKTGVTLRITDFHYLYIYVPGSGTAVIAERPFSGAREQKAAFHGNLLTVFAGGKQLQLTAANRVRGTRPAYVRFDRGAGPALRVPAVSFGDGAMLPAIWPEQDPPSRMPRLRVKVKGHRPMRSARLCRPSPRGRELCATVHEVLYNPY